MRRRRRRSSQGDRIVRHTELAARPLEGPNVGGSSGDKRWPSAAQNISIPGISVSPFAKTGESVLNFRSKSRAPCFVKEPRFPKDGLLSNYQGPQAAAHVVFQIDVHKSSIATHVGSWICSTNRHVYIYIYTQLVFSCFLYHILHKHTWQVVLSAQSRETSGRQIYVRISCTVKGRIAWDGMGWDGMG